MRQYMTIHYIPLRNLGSDSKGPLQCLLFGGVGIQVRNAWGECYFFDDTHCRTRHLGLDGERGPVVRDLRKRWQYRTLMNPQVHPDPGVVEEG